MKDNLFDLTTSIKTSLSSLKRKTVSLRSSLVAIETDIDRLDVKLDKLSQEADAYKNRVLKQTEKEIKDLNEQIESLEEELLSSRVSNSLDGSNETADELALARASTVAIIESVLNQISRKAEDFQVISHSFLFPAIYDKLTLETSPDRFITKVPHSAQLVVTRGVQFLNSLREVCETHLTNKESWDSLSGDVADWWRGEALPLLFGKSNENWDSVAPYSLDDMVKWKSYAGDRVINFPGIFDSFENYRALKDDIYEDSGVKEFELVELKRFSSVNPFSNQ